MSHYIRHILILLSAGLTCISSCTTDPEPASPVATSQEEMKIEVRSGGTRTITTTNENIYDQSFMIFGDADLGGASFDSIFNWDEVVYDKTKKSWGYGDAKQYWYMGREHSFVAIHPFISRNDDQVEILTYEDNKLSFTYCLPDKLEEAKDLLFATHRRKYSLDNTGPIKLEFTHLLPRINISMALIEKDFMYDYVLEDTTYSRNEYIKLHSIKFQGVKTKASFSFTPKKLTTGVTSTYDYEKSYVIKNEEKKEFVVTLTEACKVPNSYNKEKADDEQELKYVTALTDNEIIVMLPQEFDSTSDAKMIVNYSINEDKDLTREIVISLADKEWKEGHSYTYKFLIDNVYMGHTIEEGTIIVDIDDFRLQGDGEDGGNTEGDDSWITDDEDRDHNIHYSYDDEGNSGPSDIPEE